MQREREREVEVMDKDWNKINTLLVADCKLKEIHNLPQLWARFNENNKNRNLMNRVSLKLTYLWCHFSMRIRVFQYKYKKQSTCAFSNLLCICFLVAIHSINWDYFGSGLTHIITMDLHQKEIQGFFDIPVENLRASPFLIDYIERLVSDKHTACIFINIHLCVGLRDV